ncbi:MAG: hypothetical protein ACRCR9_02105 [Chitinophagaceae bacterium]
MKDKLNLNPNDTLYLFRAGIIVLSTSKDIHLVNNVLGHESIQTTDQYNYMLDNPESLRDIQDILVNKVYSKS